MRAVRSVLIPGCWACVLGLVLVVGTADAQFRGVRFEITQVGDTTFRFPRGTAGWVKTGSTGIAVDPRRRDVLVARFRVMSEPARPWYRGITFWGGAVFGIVIGALISK